LSDKIEGIVEEWTVGLGPGEAAVELFRRVRDIRYGTIGSRDPLDVFRKHRGTCSGKHLLLAALFRSMGLVVKDMVVFHRFVNLPRNVEYPGRLWKLLSEGDGVPDYHNFIRVRQQEKWVTIDATFDEGLRECLVVNDWDGRTDTELSVASIRMWEVENPIEFKERKLGALSPGVRSRREEFLEAFSAWLDSLRRQVGD
jgi:hypothetical protein